MLSVDEAEALFADDDNRICKPTDYAVENGAYAFEFDDEGDVVSLNTGNTFWWLRSRRGSGNLAAYVFIFGFIVSYGHIVSDNRVSVRPALLLAI